MAFNSVVGSKQNYIVNVLYLDIIQFLSIKKSGR